MLHRLILCALLLGAPSAFAQPCAPYWVGLDAFVQPLSGTRHSMAVFDDGAGKKLYVTGYLFHPSQPLQPGVVRWDGQHWEPFNDGYLPSAYPGELRILNDGQGTALYVSGWQSGVGSDWMRKWNGTTWVPVRSGFYSNEGRPRITIDGAAGPETYGWKELTNVTAGVVRWNGGGWDLIGAASGFVQHMTEHDDGSGPKLYIAGTFTSISGVAARRIARWTGATWEPLGSGIGSSTAYHMISHDDGSGPALYICRVNEAGGAQVNQIARWDGQNWSDVGGGILPVGITTVRVLASFDDGTGPALFAGGYMNMAGGGVPVRSIARFKDGVWDDMGGGLRGGIPLAMTTYDDGRGPSLFVAGEFHTVGSGAEGSARRVAQWVGCESQCYADCTNTQTEPRLTVDDFVCFIDKFAYGDPYVDCNQDGQRTIDDFHCFIARFAEGCK